MPNLESLTSRGAVTAEAMIRTALMEAKTFILIKG